VTENASSPVPTCRDMKTQTGVFSFAASPYISLHFSGATFSMRPCRPDSTIATLANDSWDQVCIPTPWNLQSMEVKGSVVHRICIICHRLASRRVLPLPC
jgi:hypothetical protein